MRSKYKFLIDPFTRTKVKLFDTLIIKTTLYGSEVWGAYVVTRHNSKENILNHLQDCKNLLERNYTRNSANKHFV